VRVVPSGSKEITDPITITFGGPFQSEGAAKLPKSDFTVSGTVQGESGKLEIISTGTAGYVTLDGASYQLPAATYSKLESQLSSVTGSKSSSASGAGLLGSLGIQPLNWLSSPQVVGQESVGGAPTTHVSATVNVAEFLRGVNTLIGHAATLGVPDANKVSSGITPAQQAKIAAHIKSPTFDAWIGNTDKTLRKVSVGVTVPITGQLHTELDGLTSVRVSVSMTYSDLNQPQTIIAPTVLKPYTEFQQKVASILEAIEGGVLESEIGSAGTGTSTSGVTTTVTGASSVPGTSTSSSAVDRYSACIEKADGDVTKMQKCTSLLGG
jgi:hypothetical protein